MGHQGWLGVRPSHFAEGWIELAMDWRADLVDEGGSLAPGAVLALMDSACGSALWAHRGVIGAQVTIDIRTDFIRPVAPGGTLFVRARCAGISGQIAHISAIGHEGDPEHPVCTAAATFMMLEGSAE
jgi:uncharacterized protein (TIGR00369 family)